MWLRTLYTEGLVLDVAFTISHVIRPMSISRLVTSLILFVLIPSVKGRSQKQVEKKGP